MAHLPDTLVVHYCLRYLMVAYTLEDLDETIDIIKALNLEGRTREVVGELYAARKAEIERGNYKEFASDYGQDTPDVCRPSVVERAIRGAGSATEQAGGGDPCDTGPGEP